MHNTVGQCCVIAVCIFNLIDVQKCEIASAFLPDEFSYNNHGENFKQISIGFLSDLRYKNKFYTGAFICGLNDANRLLSSHGYRLVPRIYDTHGDVLESIRGMTEMYMNDTLAFIGPEDACTIEANVVAAWNLPMVSFKCRDSAASRNDSFSTFVRTIPSTYNVAKSLISLLTAYEWREFIVIVGSRQTWREAAEDFTALVKQYNFKVIKQVEFTEPYLTHSASWKSVVADTHKQTRVYVFLGDDHALIDFVREMYRQGLNRGDYIVIAVQEAPYQSTDKFEYTKKYTETPKSLARGDILAFQSVLMLMPRPPTVRQLYQDFLEQTRTYSTKAPFNAVELPAWTQLKMPVPIYAAYLYDAVYVYARAVNECLTEGVDIRNGTAIVQRIRGRQYDSIQGHTISIDDFGDAEANYTVLALKDDPEEIHFRKSMRPVAHFTANGGVIPTLVSDSPIDWIMGYAPPFAPECGFDGFRCRFKPDWLTAIVCIIAGFGVLVLLVFALRHYLYEQKLASLVWKIEYKDLLMPAVDQDPTYSEKTKRKSSRRLSFLSNEDSRGSTQNSNRANNIVSSHTKMASYKGSLVTVRVLKRRHVEMTRVMRKELHIMKDMNHENINRFVGACLDPPNICIVTQYCTRGSLKDILESHYLNLDDMFIASLVFDLLKGMIYLHDSEIGCHGNLKSTNCLVDSRWVLQIADFGLYHIKVAEVPKPMNEHTYYSRLVYKSPELLRDPYLLNRGTCKSDVYAFALILYEIHGRNGPWGPLTLTPREIVERVKSGSSSWPFRPEVTVLKCDAFIVKCLLECWQEDPDSRPDFKYIRVRLKPMQRGLRPNIFDNMLAIMEKYANNLEALVAERTDQLMKEKRKTEALLHRMLPQSVAEQLKLGNVVKPELYDTVTIYFSDIVGFTSISAESTPMQVVDLLNDLYTMFDSIIGEYDVYKVETIGDAYMVVSGLPLRNGLNHAGEIASMSLHLLSAIRGFKIQHRPKEVLSLRIGLHSGSCVAGVVGLKMPRYCLFGDTVNTASRMESTGMAHKIHCSSESKRALELLGGYQLESRGYITVKGKGDVFTYFLVGEDKSHRERRISVSKVPLQRNGSTSSRTGAHNGYDITYPQTSQSEASAAVHIPRIRYPCSFNNNSQSLMSLSESTDDEDDMMTSVNSFLNGSVKYVKDERNTSIC